MTTPNPDEPSEPRTPHFSDISRWTREQLSRAAHRAFEAGGGTHEVVVLERRPWGILEWSVDTITWVDAELITIVVKSPYRGPSLYERARRAIMQPLQSRLDDLPQTAIAARHTKMHVTSGQKETASAHRANPDFDRMVRVIVAMKQVECSTAHTVLGGELANPAWFLLWNICRGRLSLGEDETILDAGMVARLTLEGPRVERTKMNIEWAWRDRSWWQPTTASFTATESMAAIKGVCERVKLLAVLQRGVEEIQNPERIRGEPTVLDHCKSAERRDGPAVTIDLAGTRLVHQEVRDAFTAFCFDPHAVLARPLLNDVSDDLTAAFYSAQETAEEAEANFEAAPGEASAWTYRSAVDALAEAWDTADIHARECGVSHLSSAEQNDVRRARRTLDLALDPNTPAGERDNAYRAVLALISGLVKVPAPAVQRMTAQIDAVHRRQLMAVSVIVARQTTIRPGRG